MKKLVVGVVVALALAAAGGAAAWRLGASRAQAALDAELAAMAQTGLRVGYARSAVSGFPLHYRLRLEEVVVASPGGAWRMNLPWIETDAAVFAPRTLTARPSPIATVALGPRPEIGFGPAPLTATVFMEGLTVETRFDAAGWAGSTLSAPALSADLAGPGGAVGARIALSAVDGGAEAAPDGLTRLRLAAEALRLAAGSADLELAAPAFEGDGAGFGAGSAAAFVASGGVARGALAWEALRLSGARVGVRGALAPFETQTGPASMSMVLAEGRAAYGVALDEAEVGFGAPVDGRATAARLEARFEAPVTTAPAPQPYALDLALETVELDDGLWAALDPEGATPREPIAAHLRLGGLARMVRGLDAIGAAGGPPVAISTVEVEQARFEGLGGAAQATGRVSMDAGRARPEGAFTLSATNWRTLIDGLETVGLLDAARAEAARLFAEAVIGAAARTPEEPADLEADVVFGDGAVVANGRRIR